MSLWYSLKRLLGVQYIQFDTTWEDGHSEGRIHWNNDDGTMEIGMPGGNVNLQVGQETIVRVTNKTGSTISNGSAVYVNGAQGSRPTIALAKSDSVTTSVTFLGLATEDIENNANGYVTTFGLVRDVDTSGFSAGDILYLSDATAGGLTNTRPSDPAYTIGVGACLNSNATEGLIGVVPRVYPDASRVTGSQVVWKDINFDAGRLRIQAAGSPGVDEFVDSNGDDTGIETFAFAPGELVSGRVEIQHDYKEGSDLYFHVHYQGIAAPTGADKVKWQLIYTIGKNGETLSPPTTITTEGDFDTQYNFEILGFPAISGTGLTIGDQFLFQLSRVAASVDEYAGDALLATAGLHYQINSIGSRNMTSK